MTTQIASIVALPNLQYGAAGAATSGYVIANDGEIGGYSNGQTNSNAAIWRGLAITSLGALPGFAYSTVLGLNDAGQAVGYSAQDFADLSHATLWQNGTVSYIGNPQDASMANAINDQGQVVGVDGPANGVGRAFVWQDGVMTYLPNLPGGTDTSSGVYDSDALAINTSGQMVGAAMDSTGAYHAVLWQHGTITDLGDPYGGAEATAINASGEVVGRSGYTAFTWQNGTLSALPHIDQSYYYSNAAGINDAGIVVGFDTSYTAGRHAVVWENGTAIDLNTLLPASYSNIVLTQAFAINDSDQILAFANNQLTYVVTLGSPQVGLTASTALHSYAAGTLSAETLIEDSAADIQGSLASLQTLAAAGKISGISLTDQGTPTLSVTAAQLSQDSAVLQDISSPYHLAVGGTITASALTAESGAHLFGITIQDSAADVAANMPNIEGLADAGGLAAIDLTDGGTPTLSIPDDVPAAAKALATITGSYQLDLINAFASSAATDADQPHVASIYVNDIGVEVGQSLDSLQALAVAGKLGGITLEPGSAVSNETNIPVLEVTPTQITADTAAIAKISGTFVVEIDIPATSQTVQGLAGEANTAAFSGTASQYTISALGSGFTVQGNGIDDAITGVQSLQFSDVSAIVAQAPGSNGQVTTGNITELYSAVLAREPDVAGLSFYQNYLTANPGTSLLQFAEWFLASPEYSQNPAHDYAQTTAGEAQFIIDSYQNLLHRTPLASEVAYYQAIIESALTGLTPGTSAYAAADAQAHAQVLVYFSASPEFLSDVQIGNGTSATAQHWLVLI
jgi:probable HAF family extracellular repeat protein